MKAGSRPVEGYFEDVAKFIAMAPKILYTRVLTELKISEKKGFQKRGIGAKGNRR